jgi:hypothetical protein
MDLDLRKKENLHIVFWLIKDFSWIMTFRELGLIMAVPTLTLSIWLTWKSRHSRADVFHNLAVTCWIVANIIWMFGEFYCEDCARPYARPAFVSGILLLGYYYLSNWIVERREKKTKKA